MKKFKWRDISDALLKSKDLKTKIFIKGKFKNKVYVDTIENFLINEKYSRCWLPLYEKKYLFSNLHKSFFNHDEGLM